MDAGTLLAVAALVLALVSLVDSRLPWLVIAVVLLCVAVLVGVGGLDVTAGGNG